MVSDIKGAHLLLSKAAQDLVMIENNAGDPRIAFDSLGFHAQQAVEKSLKAILTARTGAFPKTHDLALLMDLMKSKGLRVPAPVDRLRAMTPFATVFRYTDSITDEAAPFSRDELLTLVRTTIEWAKSEIGS